MKIHIWFLLLVNFCFSQKKISVYNNETKNPISFANVWKDSVFFKTTDSLGVFTVDNNIPDTNLKITAIGFEDKIFSSTVNEVFLKPKLNVLDEVRIIRKKNIQKESFGKFKKSGTVITAVQFDAKMALVAKFFPNDNSEDRFLNSVKFYTFTEDKKNNFAAFLFNK